MNRKRCLQSTLDPFLKPHLFVTDDGTDVDIVQLTGNPRPQNSFCAGRQRCRKTLPQSIVTTAATPNILGAKGEIAPIGLCGLRTIKVPLFPLQCTLSLVLQVATFGLLVV